MGVKSAALMLSYDILLHSLSSSRPPQSQMVIKQVFGISTHAL